MTLSDRLLAAPGAEELARTSAQYHALLALLQVAERTGVDPVAVLGDCLVAIYRAETEVIGQAVDRAMRAVSPATIAVVERLLDGRLPDKST